MLKRCEDDPYADDFQQFRLKQIFEVHSLDFICQRIFDIGNLEAGIFGAAYLAKTARSIEASAAVRGKQIADSLRVRVGWRLNSGAVGGGFGISMPLIGLAGDFSWYAHPWALTHELLHRFGYGHGWEMDHIQGLSQERFRQFQWYVVDHPEFVPDEWPIPSNDT